MQTIIDYFTSIPSAHRSALLVGGIVFFWMIENIKPLYEFGYNKFRHAGINIFFTITTILVNFPLAFILLKVSDWTQANHFGILNLLPATLNLFLFAFIGLLVLDLVGAYFIHWLEHKVKWMWRFHIIHHSDTYVDTTTANRHHPGESVFRLVFTTLAIFICGAPMWLVFLYQSLSVVLSQFNHANITLPSSIENVLNKLIVTPTMHHVHHHYVLPHTDSNFGNIFSVWDRLFGTYNTIEKENLIYGVDTVMDAAENHDIRPLLKLPFKAYRLPVGGKF
jgi:sterol desaturase/sphingolipid hydroxylase (fatty acid hydroxylase superfamily)